jgi:hypothetical protein
LTRETPSFLFTFLELDDQFRLICGKERKGKRRLLAEENRDGGSSLQMHTFAEVVYSAGSRASIHFYAEAV